MKYLTHSVVALVLVSLMATPVAARAQVAGAPTVASLQAQLIALRAQLASMQLASDVKSTTSVEADVVITSISSSKKPTISGTAEDTDKVYVTVTKEGSSKAVLKKSVKVSKSDSWKTRVSRNLSEGTYEVAVFEKKGGEELASQTFTAGKKTTVKDTKASVASSGSLSVSLVPLLMGGTARANQPVAVSYLKVVNTGKESATLTGVELTQKGSAPVAAISSLTIKDDKDGSQGQVAYTGSKVTVPTNSVFAPGQVKLFTIKAVPSASAGLHLGKTLMFEVSGVKGAKGSFPIMGTTWTLGF